VYRLVEIGRVLGLHYSTISKIVNENNSQSKTLRHLFAFLALISTLAFDQCIVEENELRA
jgi:hypothetical protein